MVFTGSYAYIQWAQESCFNTDAIACAAAKDKQAFGFEQKISSISFTNNKIPLSQLGDVRVKTFAYGQTQGTYSIDFVLSSPWWLQLAGFDTRTSCGVGDPVNHNWVIDTTTDTLVPKSYTLELGIENGTCDLRRRFTGSVVNSATISTSIGEVARVSLDSAYANEAAAVGACVLDACYAKECVSDHIPLTFAHGALYWTTCPVNACESPIQEVQCVSLSIAQNAEHLWGIGSSVAVDKFRRLLEVTGSYKASFTCFAELNKVFAQQKDTLANSCPAQTLAVSQPVLILQFWNGVGTRSGGGTGPVVTTTAGTRLIQITLTGIAIDSHSINIEPNEPIFEDIPFQASGISVLAVNGITNANSPAAT